MAMYHPVLEETQTLQARIFAFILVSLQKCSSAGPILRKSLLNAKGIAMMIPIGASLCASLTSLCSSLTLSSLTFVLCDITLTQLLAYATHSEGDLVCFQRDAYTDVPGCTGGRVDASGTDFCVKQSDLEGSSRTEIKFVGSDPTQTLGRCEGDCDTDEDCEGDLVCFQRSDCMYVPGCDGGFDDYSRSDYCVRKSDVSAGELTLEITLDYPIQLCQGKHCGQRLSYHLESCLTNVFFSLLKHEQVTVIPTVSFRVGMCTK